MMVTSILDLFEGTVSNYPSKIAFQDVKKAATFQELQQEAKAIGSAICKLSQPKRPIAVYMEKGVSNIAAFFFLYRANTIRRMWSIFFLHSYHSILS